MFRKASHFVLRVDQFAVEAHVENAAAAFDELGVNVEGIL